MSRHKQFDSHLLILQKGYQVLYIDRVKLSTEVSNIQKVSNNPNTVSEGNLPRIIPVKESHH